MDDWWVGYCQDQSTGEEKLIGNIYRYPNYQGGWSRPYYFTAYLSPGREQVKAYDGGTRFYSEGEAISAIERAYEANACNRAHPEKPE
jgi:hypothetical protein